ncbi:MAG TPA: rhodanese-like domain-containing protein [Bacteroidota bacterium]|nr:rhodanese-like domain-containing protein [Bacteroidota bacterium]
MKLPIAKLTATQKSGMAVGILGLVAAFAGSPYQGPVYTVDAQELTRVVETTVDHVSAEDVADWIIQGRTDFRLIDLRTEGEFAEYHIPGAERVPLTALAGYGLQKNEKIVIYSDGGIHSAQAWFLLKTQGYKGVTMLFGGLEAWKDNVLFPGPPEHPTPAQSVQFAKMKEVSKFFGGTPQTDSTAAATAPSFTMPKLEMPQAGATPRGTAPVKKMKEGC